MRYQAALRPDGPDCIWGFRAVMTRAVMALDAEYMGLIALK